MSISKLSVLLWLLMPTILNAQHKKHNSPAKPITLPKPDPRYFVYCPSEFPGKQPALARFLADTMNYPQAAKEANIQGRVFVTFVVDTAGRAQNIKVIRGIGGGCDEEARRVVTTMPAWQPATVNGTPVASKYTLAVKFKLE